MSDLSAEKRELREILVAANCGEATLRQLQRLDELVVAEQRLARYCAQVVDQQASLAWQASANVPAAAVHPVSASRGVLAPGRPNRTARIWRRPATIAASLAFLVGAGITSLLWFNADAGRIPSPWPKLQPLALGGVNEYEAQLVRTTGCLWDSSSTGSRQIGAALGSGESLDLLEGLAGIELSWAGGGSANLSLEGPAAMILNDHGMPTLRFGKLTGNVTSRGQPFELNTPFGRLVVSDYGSVGVSTFGNDAEIHVFGGSASLDTQWTASDARGGESVALKAGEALRLHAKPDGEMSFDRGAAEQDYFVAQVSMASDILVVPDEYVRAVKRAGPIGYWRLERDAWPLVPNVMGGRYECQVNGSIGTSGHAGNQVIEFGVSDQGGDILCNDSFDDAIGEDYSLELWIKPSHYHVGAVVSLVGDPDERTGVIPHGMLLELGGSGRMPTAVHHPGRIRFLHRSPPSDDRDVGTSCYSADPYSLRRWQHLVAVKDGVSMKLYVDGKLVGEGQNTNKLPTGLRLLVGRLYPTDSRSVRPFIGQLDELAIYGHALTPEEIEQHYRLVRSPAAKKKSI
jgi:hypothetical protein